MSVQTLAATVEIISPTGAVVASLRPTAMATVKDDAASPWVTGTTTVAMPTALQFAMLRPGAGYFLRVVSYEVPNVADGQIVRVTDRSRTALGLVELQFGGPEIDLQAYTPSTVDRSNWARQGSVPSIIAGVLDQVWGTGLWARATYGTAQAFGEDVGTPTYRTYQAATNLIANGGFENAAINGWSASGCTAAANTAWASTGQYAIRLYPNSSSTNSYVFTDVTVESNTKYTISATIRVGGAMNNTVDAAARRILVTGSVGGQGYELGRSAAGAVGVNATTRLSRTFTTPAMLDNNSIRIRLYHGQTSTGFSAVLWDDVLLVEGDGMDTDGVTPMAYFDGNTVDGTAGYNYDWQGDTAYASASTRTPIIARDPDSLTWSPGQSAWDFLQPILQASGIHLWAFGWNLTYRPGSVTPFVGWSLNEFGLIVTPRSVVQGNNLLDVSQVDSWSAEFSDGTPMFADQVILRYTWTDALNQPQEAYDVYPATGKKPYFKELENTPFAGVGRAQGLYNRISARATIIAGITYFDRAMIPGAQITVTADAVGGSVVGYVEAVTLDPFRGTTEFRTKNTVAYTSASWFSATGTWASQTGSWAADT